MRELGILTGMRDFFEDHDWIQGWQYASGDLRLDDPPPGEITGACLSGAYRIALNEFCPLRLDEAARYWNSVGKSLADAVPEGFATHSAHWTRAIRYNDDPGTSREDVILLIKKAIEAIS